MSLIEYKQNGRYDMPLNDNAGRKFIIERQFLQRLSEDVEYGLASGPTTMLQRMRREYKILLKVEFDLSIVEGEHQRGER